MKHLGDEPRNLPEPSGTVPPRAPGVPVPQTHIPSTHTHTHRSQHTPHVTRHTHSPCRLIERVGPASESPSGSRTARTGKRSRAAPDAYLTANARLLPSRLAPPVRVSACEARATVAKPPCTLASRPRRYLWSTSPGRMPPFQLTSVLTAAARFLHVCRCVLLASRGVFTRSHALRWTRSSPRALVAHRA